MVFQDLLGDTEENHKNLRMASSMIGIWTGYFLEYNPEMLPWAPPHPHMGMYVKSEICKEIKTAIII
jgi:hypothetical protein